MLKRIAGVLCIIGVVILYVGSSVFIQFVFRELEYDKPFFLTYFSTTLFTVYLCGYLFVPSWKQQLKDAVAATPSVSPQSDNESSTFVQSGGLDVSADLDSPVSLDVSADLDSPVSLDRSRLDTPPLQQQDYPGEEAVMFMNTSHMIDEAMRDDPTQDDQHSKQLLERRAQLQSLGTVVKNAFIMCFLWFVANISFNYSLRYTSVQSNQILSSTSALFTFVISLIFRVDSFSIIRLISVVLSIAGTILITLNDSKSGRDTVIGNILVLVGALGYGVYTTFLKSRLPDESKVSMPQFFGFLGLFNFLLLWPLFFALHFIGLESFALPSAKVLLALFINGAIGTVLSDTLWAWSVVLTSPIVATIGLSLTIPLAIMADILFKGDFRILSVMYAGGVVLILLAFLGVNLSYHMPSWASICLTAQQRFRSFRDK